MREKIAELAHAQWSGWMEYLFSKSKATTSGEIVIPTRAVDRWRRQMATKYSDLSDDEKDSDRAEADKFIAAFSDLERENAELKKDNESLMFLVRNQRCCRNCGNHWSGNFEVCGLGPDTVDGRDCRENDLKNWRPMEYRRAKSRAAKGASDES